jgi:ketosteroid isomerase-like protein
MDRVALVRDTWESLSDGDTSKLQAVLAPDATWRAVEDGPWNCHGAAMVVEVMERNLVNGMAGTIEDAFAVGDRVVVAFRPERQEQPQWPLEDGIRHLVVSFENDRVTELRGFPTRQAALAATAGSEDVVDTEAAPGASERSPGREA